MAEFCKECSIKYGFPYTKMYPGDICEGCRKIVAQDKKLIPMKSVLLLSISDDAFFYLAISFISLFALLFIAKAVFGFGAMLKEMKLQTTNLRIIRQVLLKTAEKQGVTPDEIESIKQDLELKYKIRI